MNISSHLNPGGASSNTFFTEGSGGFHVNGDLFFNWFMEKSAKVKGDNEERSRYHWFMNSMYLRKINELDMNNTFLVVEPILHLRKVEGTHTTGAYTVASWYGYVSSYEARNAYTIIKRMGHLANGFNLQKTSYVTSEMEQKIKNVLDTNVVTDKNLYNIKTNSDGTTSKMNFKENNKHKVYGFAMQTFWLKGMSTGTPIDKPQNTPSNAETPSEENQTTGDKSIIKLYVDLYKDPNTGYYTQIVDKSQFVQKEVSDKVTITNEENINGYKVSAWYTSDTEYNSLPLGSSMFATTSLGKTDGAVKLSDLGGLQYRINNYTTATDYPNTGGQKYFSALSSPHGTNGQGLKAQTSSGATNYTQYKRLAVKGTSNYGSYDYQINENGTTVSLGGNEKTLVVLYTREMSYISTTDTSTNKSTDERDNNSGNLKIVKVYGTIDPSTYEITDISRTVLSNTTRNVRIKNESGYNFAEWIYLTGGAGTNITASTWGNPLTYPTDYDTDQLYRLDGFVDNFKNTYNSSISQYFRFKDSITLPTIYTITSTEVGYRGSGTGLNDNETAGRYSIGSRSGIGKSSYDSTIYFGDDGSLADTTPDDKDTNDVLKPIGLYFFAFFQINN